MSMNAVPERQVLEWFEAIVALPPAARPSAIRNVCRGDIRLERRLQAMLSADGRPTRNLVNPQHLALVGDEPTVDQQDEPLPDSSGPAAPQPLSVTTGMRIDRYELIRELGRGGMGAVYLARDTRLGRRVAIKFLQSHDPHLTERFLVEAQATARCSHEHIVVIHDVRELHGNPFMVLEYLKGQPLGKVMADDRLTPSRALQLAVPIVRALVCAHAQKIVHRDLKPANIFMTESGTIKVLDFGIAKFVHENTLREPSSLDASMASAVDLRLSELTSHGMLVGTLPYMSPEQWGADTVDHRTDIWAVGILLYCMVVGRHPLAPLDGHQLMVTAVLDQPMPSARNAGVDMPPALADIIDHCLKKRRDERMPSATKLLTALEALLPGRRAPELASDENPYTGLTAFQETDAGRFFGRAHEIGAVVTRLRSASLIGVVGPSGVGKSSFIRAGVIPALKQSGELWESMVIRPGRHPMAALANIVTPMVTSEAATVSDQLAEHQATLQRLYQEPGYLGTVLRNRARTDGRKMLLFVDQFEELYTLIHESEERLAFTACLTGMADDPVSPLRLLLSIRSDFLDRVAEDQHFMGELSQSLVFVAPPDRTGLRDAIVKPAEMMRYRFETPAIVENMLDTLQTTPGCLPLLQFAATKLWEARDRDRQLLTEQSYRRLGGVVGALATHADAVLGAMPPPVQALARTVLLQLVTPERTRAIASMAELRELTGSAQEVERLIHQLVDARLLVIQRSSRNGGATVEIVHEALIQSWPTLTHWLDENEGDAVFLEQLRTAAKQWEARSRSPDLLWRGETMHEARSWHRRYRGTLPALQEEYLRAVFTLATRTARTRRAALLGIIAFLSLLVVAAAVALVLIRSAAREARSQTQVAQAAEVNAKEQAALARAAEAEANAKAAEVQRQLDVIRQKDGVIQQKEHAILEKESLIQQQDDVIQQKEGALVDAAKRLGTSEDDLAATNQLLQDALNRTNQALADAKAAQARAETAQGKAEVLAEEAKRAKQETEAALLEARTAQKKAEELLTLERARRDRRRQALGDVGQDLEIKDTPELE
jgi:hypothetical protein